MTGFSRLILLSPRRINCGVCWLKMSPLSGSSFYYVAAVFNCVISRPVASNNRIISNYVLKRICMLRCVHELQLCACHVKVQTWEDKMP